jgi:alkanesulfonate monooxygenase SsuD/methylene tetrahydromethanopterin reductase-like flavin-dependent oxidoreductase (luciferase family)
VDLGVHLPLLPFGDEPLSLGRLAKTVDAARECGFAAISANDHLVFRTAWLDGPTALASMVERSGSMTLATTVALPVVRGPVALAKALGALDVLSDGRLIAGLGPGSSAGDYAAAGVPFEERWRRFDEALAQMRALLRQEPVPGGLELSPGPCRVPLWVGSWGSKAGLARVARFGDGWLASAYNTTPERFAAARERLALAVPEPLPNALATMWTWVSGDRAECERMLAGVLAPLLNRDPAELRDRLCIGSAEHCAELLSRYAAAGCERVHLWPLGDERRQLELVAGEVAPRVAARTSASARRHSTIEATAGP